MINTFILEGELVGIHEDSIDILIEDNHKINILTSPSMISIINEVETISPYVGLQGRFITDEKDNLKLYLEKFSFLSRERETPPKKHTEPYR